MSETWKRRSGYKRSFSDSGRFLRSKMHDAPPPRLTLQERILDMIDQASAKFLVLLHVMVQDGAVKMMPRMANETFEPLFNGTFPHIYRIGPVEVNEEGKKNENGIGLAILPSARAVLGKEYDQPVILIPIMVRDNERGLEDSFVLTVSRRGGYFEVDVAIGWRNDPDRAEWPVDKDVLRELRDKVDLVIQFISKLDPSLAMQEVE